jgi:hypothetical protein
LPFPSDRHENTHIVNHELRSVAVQQVPSKFTRTASCTQPARQQAQTSGGSITHSLTHTLHQPNVLELASCTMQPVRELKPGRRGSQSRSDAPDRIGLHHWFALERLDHVESVICNALGLGGLSDLHALAVAYAHSLKGSASSQTMEHVNDVLDNTVTPETTTRFIRALAHLGDSQCMGRHSHNNSGDTPAPPQIRESDSVLATSSDVSKLISAPQPNVEVDKPASLLANSPTSNRSSDGRSSLRGHIPAHERRRNRRHRRQAKELKQSADDALATSNGRTRVQPPWVPELSRMLSDGSRHVAHVMEQAHVQARQQQQQDNNRNASATASSAQTHSAQTAADIASEERFNRECAVCDATIETKKILAHVALMHTKGFLTTNDKLRVKQQLMTEGCQSALDLLSSLPGARFKDPVPHIKKLMKQTNARTTNCSRRNRSHAPGLLVGAMLDARSVAAAVSSLSWALSRKQEGAGRGMQQASWDSPATSSAVYAALAASLLDSRANNAESGRLAFLFLVGIVFV